MWLEILLGIALIFLYIYRYVTKNFDEFKKRGIPYAEPSFPFGSSNAKEMMMGRESFWRVDILLAESERFKDEKVFEKSSGERSGFQDRRSRRGSTFHEGKKSQLAPMNANF